MLDEKQAKNMVIYYINEVQDPERTLEERLMPSHAQHTGITYIPAGHKPDAFARIGLHNVVHSCSN